MNMPVQKGRIHSLLVLGVVGTTVVGAIASGCGGDDTSTDSGSPPAEASTPDQTSVPSDSSVPDSSMPDVVSDRSTQDATSDRSMQDASPDVTSDVRQDVVGDTQAPDARDAGGDSADATGTSTDAGDAGDAGAVCSTAVGVLASAAGDVDSGSAALLFGFDNPVGLDINWGGYTDTTVSTASLGQTLSDGHSCPGALAFNVTYTTYGVTAGVFFNYQNGAGAQDWTGRTKLHAWIKLTTSNYGTLGGVQQIVHSANFADKRYGGYLSAASLTNGVWLESVVDLTPPAADAAMPDYDPATVIELEFQLLPQSTMPVGGPAAPPPATLLVDDIWLE